MGKRALLLVNRRARHGSSDLQPAIARLERAGFDLMVAQVDRSKSFTQFIAEHRQHIDAIFVGGGDGTLNLTAEAVVEANLPLGILPLGTANDLCRTLQIPTDLLAACDVIGAGHTRRIDLGWVNGKHFFNVANIGLGVRVTRRLNRRRKSRWGVFAYFLAAAHVLIRTRPMKVEIRADGETWRTKSVQITVGNGRYYGGGMSVDQEAKIDDALLNFYSLEIDNWWQIIPLLPGMWRGTLGDSPSVRLLTGSEFHIRSAGRSHHITTDGEITGRTPAHFRIVPAALSVFAPPADSMDTF
jgi:YegS/Rv2252/BmrU family lipid kinase